MELLLTANVLKSSNKSVNQGKRKVIHCNHAKKDVALDMAYKQAELKIMFEYTAPGTPHQNRIVQ